MSEKTVITLEEDQAALILDKDLKINLYIPHLEDDETAPTNVYFLVQIATAIKAGEIELLDCLERIWDRVSEEMEEKEEQEDE